MGQILGYVLLANLEVSEVLPRYVSLGYPPLLPVVGVRTHICICLYGGLPPVGMGCKPTISKRAKQPNRYHLPFKFPSLPAQRHLYAGSKLVVRSAKPTSVSRTSGLVPGCTYGQTYKGCKV